VRGNDLDRWVVRQEFVSEAPEAEGSWESEGGAIYRLLREDGPELLGAGLSFQFRLPPWRLRDMRHGILPPVVRAQKASRTEPPQANGQEA
jgi:hypothetical protein